MKRFLDVAFAVVAAVVFCAVIGYKGLDVAGVIEAPDRSFLEGRAYAGVPQASVQAVADGSFQDGTEKYLSDHVPGRSTAMLSNAALQRACIVAANVPFGWECYPTSFTSKFVAVPKRSAVVYSAQVPDTQDVRALHKFAKMVNRATKENPDVRFIYDVLSDTYTSNLNPSYDYITGTFDDAWVNDQLISRLNNRVDVLYDPIVSEDELYEQWFRTEHHWTLQRALGSYSKIAPLLGWKDVAWEEPVTVVESWQGSSARGGRDFDYYDSLVDLPTDFSELSSVVNGENKDRGARAAIMRGETTDNDSLRFSAFGGYYGGVVGETVWSNASSGNGRTVLFVEQSFGPPLEPYIARNYKTAVCVDPLNTKVEKSLQEYIDEYDIDDVVIQLNVNDLYKIAQNSPRWMK